MSVIMSLIIIASIIQLLVNSVNIRETRLLPTDGSVVHCAGQTNQNFSDVSINTFNNYSNYLSSGTKPQTFMIYFGVTLSVPIINEWFTNFTKIMNNYSNSTWYTIQMGLWFYDVNGNTFDCDIMNGKLDNNITAMIKGFNQLGRPIYLRIGYEFNGQWTGFTPKCYIGAFQHITNMLRKDEFCKNNVATVWDFTADAGTDPYPFYPGDDYVDWWGMLFVYIINEPKYIIYIHKNEPKNIHKMNQNIYMYMIRCECIRMLWSSSRTMRTIKCRS